MSKTEKAFVAPFFAFLLCIGAVVLVQRIFEETECFWLNSPKYWIFPLQTLLCGWLLFRYWPVYRLRFTGWGFGILIGVAVFAIWIAPQELFHAPGRYDGFDPYATGHALTPFTLGMRFLRLVVVVPLVEEIFWRGYLLRYLVDHEFARVPLGKFTWLSFGVVTGAFVLVHLPADYPAALLTGALFNWVVYRTKSLGACVVAHAVANALLGGYILRTGQWGFW